MNNKNEYNANKIQIIEGIEHIRNRPSMYIGNTNINGIHQMIYEIINNSVDESLIGYCNKIKITINNNLSVIIEDNGRGIPVDIHKKNNKSALEIVMTKIGSGGKFDKKSYKISGGLHGIGLSCVNALSSKLTAIIYRNGYKYKQSYMYGKPINNITIVGNTKKRGTKIIFFPDTNIFKNINYNFSVLNNRFKELTYINNKLTIILYDKIHKKTYKFHSKYGIKEFINSIIKNKKCLFKKNIYKNIIYDNIHIELIMTYIESNKEKIYSYVNSINIKEGGTHIIGFNKGLINYIKEYINKQKNKYETYINNEDIKEGLVLILSIKIPNPEFEGQTKNKLNNIEIIKIMSIITKFILYDIMINNEEDFNKLINKIILNSKSRFASKKAENLIKKKYNIFSSILPIKLSDCISKKFYEREIYLVEGDSAGGTAKQGRERKFQAILPLKGKILNVEKSNEYKTFKNEEIKNILLSLGITVEQKNKNYILNTNNLRYSKIIIMTDADVDGSHISTLLLTFFFKYMKNLINYGYIYIVYPPLYLIKILNKNIYVWSNKDKNEIINLYSNNNDIKIQRYKGLGEMNANQLWETTMNPTNRNLRKIIINDYNYANKIFSILMGDNVNLRKKFIINNAKYAKVDI